MRRTLCMNYGYQREVVSCVLYFMRVKIATRNHFLQLLIEVVTCTRNTVSELIKLNWHRSNEEVLQGICTILISIQPKLLSRVRSDFIFEFYIAKMQWQFFTYMPLPWNKSYSRKSLYCMCPIAKEICKNSAEISDNTNDMELSLNLNLTCFLFRIYSKVKGHRERYRVNLKKGMTWQVKPGGGSGRNLFTGRFLDVNIFCTSKNFGWKNAQKEGMNASV